MEAGRNVKVVREDVAVP